MKIVKYIGLGISLLLFWAVKASAHGVVAWGDSSYGQTTVPAGLTNVTAIEAGYGHTVALKSDGTVVAWGLNEYGQTTVPASLSNVTAIAASWQHTLALKSDGTLVAWGLNNYGQTNVPGGLIGVAAIAAGAYNTVALKSDGTVVVWGRYYEGQTDVPAGLSGVAAIAAGGGYGHIVALKSDGTVVAWGRNNSGQTSVPAGLNGVTAIAAGDEFSAALKNDGTVVAWGYNAYGQTTVPAGLIGVTAIAAGDNHILALKVDGAVVAWGNNSGGQTAVPSDLNGAVAISAGRSSFALVTGPMILRQPSQNRAAVGGSATLQVTAIGDEPFTYQWRLNGNTLSGATDRSLVVSNAAVQQSGFYTVIVSNSYHSVTSAPALLNVLTNPLPTSIVAWGDNSAGQTNVPDGIISAVAVSAGYAHNLALISDGTVMAWGSNSVGQLDVPPGLSNVVAVSAGGSHNLALKSDGSVVAWGSYYYDAGRFDYGPESIPIGLSNVVAISTGTLHSLALKSDGTVEGWGNRQSARYQGQDVPHWNLSDVIAIAAGNYHSLALQSDGRVVGWGYNYQGQATVPASLSNVVQIAAGGSQSLALKSDGTVVAWGPGGQAPEGLSNVVAIACGGSENQGHNLALTGDGTVVAWGDNSYGQTTGVEGLANVFSIAAATRHILALRADEPLLSIVSPPKSTVANAGSRTRFRVTAAGSVPLRYQWKLNGLDIPGATNSQMEIAQLGATNAGTYSIIVSNSAGMTVSATATLTVISVPVVVSNPPLHVRANSGTNVTFLVEATSASAINYQWRLNGMNIARATGSSLTVSNVFYDNQGLYTCVVSNVAGFVSSRPSRLTVNVPSTVVAWGANTAPGVVTSGGCDYHLDLVYAGQSVPPDGLTDIVAVAAGDYHSLALRGDGTVVGWGYGDIIGTTWCTGGTIVSSRPYAKYAGQASPPGLTNVVAIAASGDFSLALKGDGTVIAWGSGQLSGEGPRYEFAVPIVPPPNLTNAVAIAARGQSIFAFRSDGTVVSWGEESGGPPSSLTNDLNPAVYGTHTIQLLSDGTVVDSSQTPPVNLRSVIAAAPGLNHSLALRVPPPNLTIPLTTDRQAYYKSNITFTVGVSSPRSLAYQWFFNGTLLANATNSSLTFLNLDWTNSGNYTVMASNFCGVVSNTLAIGVILPPGSEGWWPLNEGIGTFTADVAGTNNGTLINSSLWVDGNFGKALQFNGINQYVRVASKPIIGQRPNFTVEAWIKWNGSIGPSQSVYVEGSYNDLISLYLNNGVASFTVLCDNWRTLSIGPALSTNQWHHLAATVESGVGGRLYVDGQLLGTDPNFSAASQSGLETDIGRFAGNGGSRYFSGLISEVQVANIAKTAAAIRADFEKPVRILSQPQDQIALLGTNVMFSVVATNLEPFTYQWQFNETNIAGATNAFLALTDVKLTQAGGYRVVVSNAFGTGTSDSGTLTVVTAMRFLPPGYWPEIGFTVSIQSVPPPGIVDYAVEDDVPYYYYGYWVVGAISDGGTFDQSTARVKWGPFFDDSPRTLTYVLIPPAGISSDYNFSGTISIDGIGRVTAGMTTVSLLPLYPADNNPAIDNIISLNEVTGYASAWKKGVSWPVTPNPIPINYMTQAGLLWKGGEYYGYAPSNPPPFCWINATPPSPIPQAIPAIVSTNAFRTMTNLYTTNSAFTVAITITPVTNVSVYAVEEQVLPGLTFANFSTSGVFDAINRKIKWGPFFDNSPRTLSYQVVAPSNAPATLSFAGAVSFDGFATAIAGIPRTRSGPIVAPDLNPSAVISNGQITFTLTGSANDIYQIETSTDLVNWSLLSSVINSDGMVLFTEPAASNLPGRFYRAVVVP